MSIRRLCRLQISRHQARRHASAARFCKTLDPLRGMLLTLRAAHALVGAGLDVGAGLNDERSFKALQQTLYICVDLLRI